MPHENRVVPLTWVKPNPRNARNHPRAQIRAIARSIEALGFAAPLLTDESGELLAGHARLAAAKLLELEEVPVVILSGLTDAKKRALLIADNKLAEKAGWDREQLAAELQALTELLVQEDLEIAITGFEPVEIDTIALDFEKEPSDPADDLDSGWKAGPAVSRPGDLWQLGKHKLLCGSALAQDDLARLMGKEEAAVAFLDPPYNVMVKNIGGRGRTRHPEFAMASGEMSESEFESFLSHALGQAAAVSNNGAVHFVCMDWRHVTELVAAGRRVYGEMLNLVVWTKTNAGQGAFYRSQHELIGVFRVGTCQHLNNVELGRHGRNRSNVWRYAGVNSFKRGRMDELSVHPTVKPVAMIADALKDCSRRGEIVLDTFCGSGSTLLAAERVGRRGFGIELAPGYVDVAIRRWQAFTGCDAVLTESGRTFCEVAADRAVARDDER